MIKLKWFTSLSRLVCNIFFVFTLLTSIECSAGKHKIVVLDFDYVIRNSLTFKAIQAENDRKHSEYKKEISDYEDQIIELTKKIENDKTLSEKELSILKNDLNNREINIRKTLQKRRLAINNSHSEVIDALRKQILDLAKQEADKNGYQVIISKSSVIYNVDSLDISDKILSYINKKTS